MKKLYESVLFIGFVSFFIGGLIIVFAQAIGLVIDNPNVILLADNISKFIFPDAAISGLLCFLHPYIFKKNNNA